MNGAPQFFDALAKPKQFFVGDAIMLRLCRALHYAERTQDARAFP
jgi:hypothetical protein